MNHFNSKLRFFETKLKCFYIMSCMSVRLQAFHNARNIIDFEFDYCSLQMVVSNGSKSIYFNIFFYTTIDVFNTFIIKLEDVYVQGRDIFVLSKYSFQYKK